LKKCHSVCAWCFVSTSGLNKRRACGFFTTGLVCRNYMFTGCRMPCPSTTRVKKCHIRSFSNGTDRAESEQFSRDYHWGWVVVRPLLSDDSVWVVSRDELPQIFKQKSDREKCLILIFWSIDGIRSLLDFPKRTTYNTVFFTDAVIPCLTENVCSRTHSKTLKCWFIHMDHTCPHDSGPAQSCIWVPRTEYLLHPADSPDQDSQVTSFSLHISREKYLMTIVRDGRTSWTRSLKFSVESTKKYC
jgi:hypothetical protein